MTDATWLGFVVQKAPQNGYALKQVVIDEGGAPQMVEVMFRSSLAEINQYRLSVEQAHFGEASWFPSALQAPYQPQQLQRPAQAPPPAPPEEAFQMPQVFNNSEMPEAEQSLVNRVGAATGFFKANGRTNSFVAFAFCTSVALSFGLRSLVA